MIRIIPSGSGILLARMIWQIGKLVMSNTNAQQHRPFTVTTRQAVAHLKASGNWPVPRIPISEAECDYYVVAAFWGFPNEFRAYLTRRLATMMVAWIA